MTGYTNGNGADGSTLLRSAQDVVRSLTGVLAAEVHPDGGGGISSVHVVASDAYDPEAVRRNIRSALLARFGVVLPPEAVSVRCVPGASRISPAEMDGVRPAGEPRATAPASPLAERATVRASYLPRPEPRVGLQNFELERKHPNRVHCRVLLTLGAHAYLGEAEGLDTPEGRLETAALATLDALRKAAGGAADTIELEGAREVYIAGRTYVVAAARLVHGRSARDLAGAAAVEASPEYTAALALLQATNRWLGGRLWAESPMNTI